MPYGFWVTLFLEYQMSGGLLSKIQSTGHIDITFHHI